MLKLNNIADKASSKGSKRVGRGIGSGKGKTSGAGHKGQKSRSGVAIKGFEGGQMPLQRRIPKFGFKNVNRKIYQGINLDTIQKLVDSKKLKTKLDFDLAVDLRLIRKNELMKILGRGDLKAKLKVSAHKFTSNAKTAIEKAGGEAIEI